MAGFAVPVSIAAFSSALAQTSQMPQVLPVTVVSAARYEQPIEDVVADITVIDRAEIERYGAGTINELLSRLPGVQSIDVGSPQLFIRGANANMTAVYVDGVRVDPQDKGSGNPRLGTLDLSQVQRIEILRGSASSLYGAKAMGGVIQLFTDGGQPGARANVGAGSEGLKTGGFGLSGQVDDQLSYRFGLQRSTSDGYYTDLTPLSMASSMPWRRGSLNAGVDLKINASHTLRYVLNATEYDAESNSDVYDPVTWQRALGPNARARSNTVTSGLRWSGTWTNTVRSEVALSTTRMGVHGSLPETFETRAWDFSAQVLAKTEAGEFGLGLEQKLDRLQADRDANNLAVSGSRGQTAASLSWSHRVQQLSWQVNLRVDDDEFFSRTTSGGLAGAFQITPALKLRAGVSTGFRAPTLEQILGAYGSRDLKPENSLSKELALAYSQGADSASATLYSTRFNDMLATDSSFNWKNLATADVEGLTLSARTKVGVATVLGSFDAMRARNGETGQPLNYRPDESATIDVMVPVSDWRVGAQWQGVGQRYYSAGSQSLRGYALLNLYASKALTPNWTLQTRLDNAADRDYDGDGYNATPDRRWFVGLQWQDR
ncbi:TonB-dependent receptor [Comamonadaceae bacterium M7527]|nr:TonB-dependent receptor [Comamonadaceae bacterium M7527]